MQVRGTWMDMYNAMENARNFIFLTGWSFHPEIRLIRPDGPMLGEVLKKKALEGVKVSASFLAEISVRPPRKIFIFIIPKNIFWIKVSKKKLSNFENRSTG